MALDQIGQKLKSARESHGLSLGQIFERTKIPINHLESIDNGLVDELPEPVYVAGYIKRYADCVGLNGQGLSDEYRRQNGGGNNGNKSNGGSPVSSRIMSTPVLMSAPSYSKAGDMRQPNIFKQGLWYALLIVMVVGIMAILSYWQSNYNAVNQTDPTQALLQRRYSSVMTAPAQTTPGQAGQSAAPSSDANAPTPLPSDNEASVAISASQHVWVEVVAVSTGQNLYTGFMERGERKDYKDPQGVRVHAGNGASITVENQGKSETLGLPGKIAEKTFMSKSAASTASSPLIDAKAQAAAAAAAKALAVKKVIKRSSADAAPRRRPRSDDAGSSSGSGGGSHSSIDVPYRYTESND